MSLKSQSQKGPLGLDPFHACKKIYQERDGENERNKEGEREREREVKREKESERERGGPI